MVNSGWHTGDRRESGGRCRSRIAGRNRIEVRVLELIEVFDRIYLQDGSTSGAVKGRPRFHFVIADYLCERLGGEPRAGSDVTEVAFARQEELARFHLTETATRVLRKAFAMAHARQSRR